MKNKFRNIILIILLVSLCMTILPSFGAGGSFQEVPLLSDRFKIMENTDNYTPNQNIWPFDDDANNIRSVGIDKLYGNDKNLIQYLGEIPYDIAFDKKTKKYRVFMSSEIDGDVRPWSDENSESHHGFDKNNVTPEEAYNQNDLHLLAMIKSKKAGSKVFFDIVFFLAKVMSLPLELAILIKSIDITYILEILDDQGTIAKMFNTLFLFDPDTGAVSPFLVLSLIMFIISCGFLVFKMLKGHGALRPVLEEMGWLLLAILIASLSIFNASSGNNELAGIAVNFADKLSNTITTSSSANGSLYLYNTGNPNKDSQATQSALIKQPFIETLIELQFGEKVEELQLGEGKFGNFEDQALEWTFNRENFNDNNFKVSNGEYTTNNLGYYWWAANSNVDEKRPLTQGTVNMATSDRILYIVDFLNNLRKLDSSNIELVGKIDNMMSHIEAPRYGDGILSVFMLGLLSLSETYALLIITIFLTIGKLIVSIGLFAVPILPGLMLFDKTRSLVKKLCKTYFTGFLRVIIGLLMFNLVISLAIIFSQRGIGGILLGILICLAIGKLAPRLMIEITKRLQRQEIEPMMALNNLVTKSSSSIINNRQERNRARRENGAYSYSNKNGIETKKERNERISEERMKTAKTGLEKFGLHKEDDLFARYKIGDTDPTINSEKANNAVNPREETAKKDTTQRNIPESSTPKLGTGIKNDAEDEAMKNLAVGKEEAKPNAEIQKSEQLPKAKGIERNKEVMQEPDTESSTPKSIARFKFDAGEIKNFVVGKEEAKPNAEIQKSEQLPKAKGIEGKKNSKTPEENIINIVENKNKKKENKIKIDPKSANVTLESLYAYEIGKGLKPKASKEKQIKIGLKELEKIDNLKENSKFKNAVISAGLNLANRTTVGNIIINNKKKKNDIVRQNIKNVNERLEIEMERREKNISENTANKETPSGETIQE